MAIIFKEDRELVKGGKVRGGQAYDHFSPAEEQAFVDNGVATVVNPEPGAPAPATGSGEEEVIHG